jgi:hypothetical protein
MNALQIDIDHLVPLVGLEPFQWRERHHAGIVEHDIDPTERFDRCIDESLYLIPVSYIGLDG